MHRTAPHDKDFYIKMSGMLRLRLWCRWLAFNCKMLHVLWLAKGTTLCGKDSLSNSNLHCLQGLMPGSGKRQAIQGLCFLTLKVFTQKRVNGTVVLPSSMLLINSGFFCSHIRLSCKQEDFWKEKSYQKIYLQVGGCMQNEEGCSYWTLEKG